jgi:rhodanese-related sulfurtransferase
MQNRHISSILRQPLIILCFITMSALRAESVAAFDAMVRVLLSHSVPELSVDAKTDVSTFVILDTREKSEFEVSHVRGAIWVGYDDFEIRRISHLPKVSRILLYCSVGYRSEKVAEKLRIAGYRNVTNMVGGIFAWVNSGRRVVDSKGAPTRRVHGYSRAWGVWVNQGTVVYE